MVYTGKPSTGCQNCKRRRIKCDEARPACSPCTKTKLTCPGYRGPLDLVLRDQNKVARDKVQGRKPRKNTSPSSKSSSSTSPEPSNNAKVFPITANARRSSYLPTELMFNTPEHAAICVFFSNVVFINQHPDTRRGCMQAVLPLYNAARAGSLLHLAVTTVSLAMFGMSRGTQDFICLGQQSFCKALLATGKAIEDPIDSLKDETLMAVLLLSLFERLASIFESAELSGVHDAGAAALIKHRGKELNTRSYTSIMLLYAVYTQVVDHLIDDLAPPSTNVTICADLAAGVPQNTATRLTPICVGIARLRSDARRVLGIPFCEDDMHKVFNHALEINALLESWAQSVGDDWHWVAADHFETPQGFPESLFSYRGRMDIYYDIHMAGVWNFYRTKRTIVLSIILDCIAVLGLSSVGTCQDLKRVAIHKLQKLADDICGTVPWILGTRMHLGLEDGPAIEYPYVNNQKVTEAHRRSAANVGGWKLIEPHNQPLKTMSNMPYLREGQKEWLLAQHARIMRIYDIRVADSKRADDQWMNFVSGEPLAECTAD